MKHIKNFKFTSRKVFIPLILVVCISLLCLSVFANTDSAYCDKYGHTIHTIISHGTLGMKTAATESYCWQQYHYQCVAECYFCGEQFLTDHREKEQHIFVNVHKPTGDHWECTKCGYIK